MRGRISEHVTATLAEFTNGTTFEDIPKAVVHEAKRLILDCIGCALGGYVTEIGAIMTRVVRSLGGTRESTVVGCGDRTSCVNAAHANARMGNALDADDTFLCVAHHGVPTVFSALAVGERYRRSGRDLITSVAVGFDVGARVGIAVGPPIYDASTQDVAGGRGRGATNVLVPPLAAAAAAASVMRLPSAATSHAFGIAGEMAGLGSSLKSRRDAFFLSKAGFAAQAEVGAMAAVLADAGMQSNDRLLDGEHNQLHYAGFEKCNFKLMLGRLGRKWYIQDTTYKAWPACGWIRYPLTAFTHILQSEGLSADEIERVVVRAAPVATTPRFSNQDPQGLVNCQFNHPHAFAMVALGYTPGPGWFTAKAMNDERVHALRHTVEVELEPESVKASQWFQDGQIRKLPASVQVMARGKCFSAFVEYAKGDPWTEETFLTDDELKEKFRNFALAVDPINPAWQRRVEQIIQAVFHMEDICDLADFARLVSPQRGRRA